MSLAARWMARQRRMGNTPGPLAPAGEEGKYLPLHVEFFIDDTWQDITSKGIRYSDKIVISRGRKREDDIAPPQTCRFTVNNNGGWLSPRNPYSEFFGRLGQNTPVRVYKYQGVERRYRFAGHLADLPVKWDKTGRNNWVELEAAGPLRRLNQGNKPINSAIFTAITQSTAGTYYGYWPFESQGPVRTVPSGFANGQSMRILQGDLSFSDTAVPISSAGSIALKESGVPSSIYGSLSGPSSTDWTISYWINIPDISDPATDTTPRIYWFTPGGTYTQWNTFTDSTDGTLNVEYVSDSGSFGSTAVTSNIINIGDVQVTVRGVQSGSDITITIYINGTLAVTDTVTSATNSGIANAGLAFSTNCKGNVSHYLIGDGTSATLTDITTTLYDAGLGYPGESPASRIERVCAENNVPVLFVDSSSYTEEVGMGPQKADTLISILRDCEKTGQHILFEWNETYNDQPSLLVRTRLSQFNQDPWITLDYAAHELGDALEPLDDDSNTVNDFTLSREDGLKVHASVDSGPKSTLDPPNGVGQYSSSDTISLDSDDNLLDHAMWRLHLGTVDEARYPQITLYLHHPSWTNDQLTAIYNLDAGDRIVITNVPSPPMPPDDISLLVRGYEETIDQFEHVMVINCVPESPYHIGLLDDTVKRLDTDGSTTVNDFVSGTDTTLIVATSDSNDPPWIDSTNHPSDFPFNLSVGGVILEVTAISGTTSPQTFTITQTPVNGVAKTIPSGSAVNVANPFVLAL